MNKAHKSEWEETKKKRFLADGARQKIWGDADYELLCRGEEEYDSLPLEARRRIGINMFIQAKYYPELTTQTVGSQRKYPKYREFRDQRNSQRDSATETVAEEEEQKEGDEYTSPSDESSVPPAVTYDCIDRKTAKEIESKPLGSEILVVNSYLTQGRFEEANSKAIFIFDELAKQFTRLDTRQRKKVVKPAQKRGGKKTRDRKGKIISPSRLRRREQYAIVQKKFKRANKRKSLVNRILAGTLGTTSELAHTSDELANFWQGLFSRESPQDKRKVTNPKKLIPELDRPITAAEVASALNRASEAATGIDGVPLKHLREIGSPALAILYNGLHCYQVIPQSWKEARTVLIPKSDKPASPGEYRPITISSYYYRIYSSTISRRLADSIELSYRQKGFTKADGVRDNLVLLETIIEDSKRTSSSLNLTFMDVKKAFDSVSHHSIDRALVWGGVPKGMRRIIADMYTACSTDLYGTNIKVTRGVKQGDPLSSTLFNLVLEMALSKISDKLGIKYEGIRLFYMAFADDLVLLSRSLKANQHLVDEVVEELGHVGLELHPAKCKSLSLRADPKRKTTFVDKDEKITINGVEIPSLDTDDTYKYLGIKVGSRGMPQGRYIEEFEALLTNTSRAPLKPHQRLYILRTYILPRFNHRMMFEKVTCNTLDRLDKIVREYVRKWLKLLTDVPISAFYADIASGGLGLLSLRQRIPLYKMQRTERMGDSNDPLTRAVYQSRSVQNRLQQWRKRCKVFEKEYDSKQSLTEIVRAKWWSSCDGKGLKTDIAPSTGRKSFRLLRGDKTSLKPAQFIGAVGVRLNSLGTPVRKNRAGGRSPEFNLCDKCPGYQTPATLWHISQTCPAVHGLRVKRHDKVVNKLADHFRGREGTKAILIEPDLRVSDGKRKPDLVIDTGDTVEIIDAQIRSDMGFDRDEDADEQVKLDRYDTEECKLAAYQALGIPPGSVPCNVSAFTLTWRGNPAPHSYKLAKRLGFTSKLKYIVADSLVDTWGMFVVWNKTS